MKRKPRISVITLGCSKNVVDSEVLLAQLNVGEATVVDDVEDAEIAVINTCGFIDAAKQESIDAIVEAVDRKSERRLQKVVVMGCLSERFGKELAQEIPGVDAYFGSNQLRDVLNELGVDYKRELVGERLLTTPSHTAYLKISEGCDHPCSFCAIPLMRGHHRTRPMEEVLIEARLLASKGVKELIVIGQDTTYYGLDLYGKKRLHDLLEQFVQIAGIEWIRLMYAFPSGFPLDVLDVFQKTPKLCRYIDIPVQHASDSMLKSMRRGMTNRSTRELLERIRTTVPDVALRTTLIVGYPGETDCDFEVLCDFVKEMQFHRLGVFTYSQEEGTAAHALGDPIPESIKEERRMRIMQLQQEISERRNESLLGREVKLLLDRRDGEILVGRTEWDAPEIDQEVYLNHVHDMQPGNFCRARIVESTEYDLFAVAV